MTKFAIAGVIVGAIYRIFLLILFVVLLLEAIHHMTSKEWDAAAAYIAALMLLKLNEIDDKL